MTIPAWPFDLRITTFPVEAAVPFAEFRPDFGPVISRPRATALSETVNVEVIFPHGDFHGFRTWWATTTRGGDFTALRPDTGETAIYRPIGRSYSATVVRATIGAPAKFVRVQFAAHLIVVPE